MKIVVIGSGLIGLTTAYFLNRRGHEVVVVDRREGPGLETSFANGALLTPSMSDPWNAPGVWRTLLSSIGRSSAAMQLRANAIPGLMGWGITFLRHSSAARYERNTLTNLRLALYSLKVMQCVRDEVRIEYGRDPRGTLRVFRDVGALEAAFSIARSRAGAGLELHRLSRDEVTLIEPALEPIASRIVGALHYVGDETGDAHRFCVALADHAREQGVAFHFGTEISSLEMNAGSVVAASCGSQRFVADRYVVAAGSYTAPVLRTVGIHVPVQPAKGYSITFDSPANGLKLKIPVIDDHLHAGVVPLGNAIRVVGTAEFAGFDRTLNTERIRNLQRLLEAVLPQVRLDPSSARPWCGLRPMSADGVPIIGPTAVPNLLINTGHGHLGWTMAAGSAQLLADFMSGQSPSIDPAPYALARFGTTC